VTTGEAESTGGAESPVFRSGYVTIMGEPNVGKSTLLNRILQQKISIVSSKPQTTRHRILGILTEATYQIVFLDTPGIIKPRYLLQEAMMQFAGRAIADADVLLFMIDALDPKTGPELAHAEAFQRLRELQKPVVLVINKIDLVPKPQLLPVIEFYSQAFPFREIFPVSALNGDGVRELQSTLVPLLPMHPPLYPPDIVSEQSERFFVSEIIREKVFRACHEEVPYATTVDVLEFKERAQGKWFIAADIYVERDSQKGILIGKKGSMLKDLGAQARRDIEVFLGHPVFLELHVKVREKWRDKPEWLQRLGYGGG
jgi:GTP-binding protein Era